MIYSKEVEQMCPVTKGAYHGPAPIPEEGKWVQAKEIKDISGLTHGVGWCAPQQGACKLTLNVKDGIIEEALVETLGCTGMTHSAAMASEILPGKTLLEALNTDLVGKNLRSQVGTMFGTKAKGARYLEMTEGYVTRLALNENNEIVGYEFVNLGKLIDALKANPEMKGSDAIAKARGQYGQFNDAAKYIDPRHE